MKSLLFYIWKLEGGSSEQLKAVPTIPLFNDWSR
ncbi:UNVERIFIED_ORG: hypothetical protein J3A77_000117 [Bacillus sp. PvP124]|nr:hypothetical protein [Bacillus sp. PvP124]MDP9580557.1 hypothetical protein [Bacillus sp. 1751]